MTNYICSKMFTDLNIKFPYNCVKNCCKSNDVLISLDELNSSNFLLENKEYVRRKSSMLLDNKLPENGCDTCIHTEPNSLFRTWNRWKNNFSDKEKDLLLTADKFNTYEFVLSSACDLKCVYCAPKDSSSWAKELGVPVNKGSSEWEEKVLDKLFDHLSKKTFDEDYYYFFFSGGEPTYNPKTLWMIEEILKYVPLDKSKIIISTNANTKKAVFDKYIDLIKSKPDVNWIFDCSIDGLYEKCEAIRYGINWDTAISNISQLLEIKNVDVRISPTINLYSIPEMYSFVKFFIQLFESKNKLHPYLFNFNMVQEPDLSPMSMPVQYRDCLIPAIEHCKNYNVKLYEHLENVYELIGTKIDNNTAALIEKKFDYFKNKRPTTDWELLFPHVSKIITELKAV